MTVRSVAGDLALRRARARELLAAADSRDLADHVIERHEREAEGEAAGRHQHEPRREAAIALAAVVGHAPRSSSRSTM